MESKKMFYTMGEIVEMFDVSPALIRHWESQFEVIKPRRNKKGNRLFSPSDLENFKIIHHLVRERGMTLSGAKQAMRKGALVDGSSLERDAQITERLMNLRSMLVELRNMMKDGQEPINAVAGGGDEQMDDLMMEDIVAGLAEKSVAEVPEVAVQLSEDDEESLGNITVSDIMVDATDRELFAFYEQRLPLSSGDEDEYEI